MQDQPHSFDPGNGDASRRPAQGRRRRTKLPPKGPAPTSLAQALQAIPASRDGVVPRARKLVHDPRYPSDATLHQIAQLFLSHLDLDEKSF